MGKIITIVPVESISGKLGGKEAPIGFAKRTQKNKNGEKVNYTVKYGKRSTQISNHEKDIRGLFTKRRKIFDNCYTDVARYRQLWDQYKKSSGFNNFRSFVWNWVGQEVTFENFRTYTYTPAQMPD